MGDLSVGTSSKKTPEPFGLAAEKCQEPKPRKEPFLAPFVHSFCPLNALASVGLSYEFTGWLRFLCQSQYASSAFLGLVP
jgi:hypothetical protein